MAKRSSTLEGLVMSPNVQFWSSKRVLLTGHTGFKGAWLALWLQQIGAEVTGVSLDPVSEPNLYELLGPSLVNRHVICDICDSKAVAAVVHKCQPEIVLHLAAKTLVRESYQIPLQTYATNIMGTAHILDALRDLPSIRVALMITTDKVYSNNEYFYPYRESDTLGGHDPYSASKAASEILIASYRKAFLCRNNVAVASARAGNVIGGGDWAADRIIPDAVRAWQSYQPLHVRRPDAVRPWQHVLEPLAGYLRLAECLWERPEFAGAYNFGPPTDSSARVQDVVKLAVKSYGAGEVIYNSDNDSVHETSWLTLETAKARNLLGVKPRWTLPETVARTMAWYRELNNGASARSLCLADIKAYCETA